MRVARARAQGDMGDDDAINAARARAESINLFRNYELRTAYAPEAKKRLPITLITGFLGSGKTTLAKRALENRQSLRVACAVNDFAAINVDARVVRRSGADAANGVQVQVTELTNGCVCCALRDDLEAGVAELLNADDDGSDIGSFDYVLIETSGLVDPSEVVTRLDRSFGPLTRARLDGVVCVVEAETAAAGGPDIERDVWDAQLACADIVLLNKIDLIRDLEDADAVLCRAREVVSARAPGARVIECVDADVPLPSILDVDMIGQPEGKSGHDWGASAMPYVLSPTGGRLRKRKQEEKVNVVTRGPFSLDPTKKTTHVPGGAQSTCNSLAYEGTKPLVFARFQHWATAMIPKSTARSKGVVTFVEDVERVSYDFHFSGKSRLELEPSVGELASATSTCLVIIGVDLDEDSVMRDIRTLEEPLPVVNMDAVRRIKEDVARAMAEDLRFEIMDNSDDGDNALVSFRLTGAASNGFTVAELEESHGVDFNAMNLELLRAVNAGGTGTCLVPTSHPSKCTKFGVPQLFLRLAVVNGDENNYDGDDAASKCLDTKWMEIRRRATRILERSIAHIPQCKCGF